MRLKTALLLTLYFVGVFCRHGNGKAKLRKDGSAADGSAGKIGANIEKENNKIFVGLGKQVEQIEKKIVERANVIYELIQ